MKSVFKMTDEEQITSMMDRVAYGTLALCADNRPYSVPINFVTIEESVYFHGAKRGKKMEILAANKEAAFSIVEPFSVIPSYFSSDEGLACPATHFFRSIMIEGRIEMVTSKEEKIKALSALMQKLQPEGKYRPFEESVYDSSIDATALYKLNIANLSAKYKFGQHLTQERFDKILKHLQMRGEPIDQETAMWMKRSYHDSL